MQILDSLNYHNADSGNTWQHICALLVHSLHKFPSHKVNRFKNSNFLDLEANFMSSIQIQWKNKETSKRVSGFVIMDD